MKHDANEIVFKNGDNIGYPDADFDAEYLEDCFISLEGLDVLTDVSRSESLLLVV